MSNTPYFTCRVFTAIAELGGLMPSVDKKTESSSPSPALGDLDSFLCGDLNPDKKYTMLEAADYLKLVDASRNMLQLPFTTSPPPDVLRRGYEQSLLKKNAIAVCLADAEQTCQNWEGAWRQMLSEAEVQKISQAHCVVDIDEADTAKGQYTMAVACPRMRDFSQHRMGRN